jgi:hypothetical protein
MSSPRIAASHGNVTWAAAVGKWIVPLVTLENAMKVTEKAKV